MTRVSGQRNGDPRTAFLYGATGAPGSLVYISNGSSVNNLLFEPQANRSFSAWTGANDMPGGFIYQTAGGEFNPFTNNGLTCEYKLTAGGSDDAIPMQSPATEETSGPASLALAGANLPGLARLLRRRCRRGRAPGSRRIVMLKVEKSPKALARATDTVIELNSCGPGTFGI